MAAGVASPAPLLCSGPFPGSDGSGTSCSLSAAATALTASRASATPSSQAPPAASAAANCSDGRMRNAYDTSDYDTSE